MEPEDPKDRDEKCCHNDEDPIEHWLSLWIIMGRMGSHITKLVLAWGWHFPQVSTNRASEMRDLGLSLGRIL